MLKFLSKSLLIFILVVCFANIGYLYVQVRFALDKPFEDAVPVPSNSTVQQRSSPNEIVIRSINLRAPLVYPTLSTDGDYQSSLMQGVVHYPGTAEIGEIGNAYFFAHSSDLLWRRNPFAHVFALLPKVQIGSEVTLTDGEGNLHTYTIYEKFVADPDSVELLRQDFGVSRVLTLQTSYPFGTALKRFILRAKMP